MSLQRWLKNAPVKSATGPLENKNV